MNINFNFQIIAASRSIALCNFTYLSMRFNNENIGAVKLYNYTEPGRLLLKFPVSAFITAERSSRVNQQYPPSLTCHTGLWCVLSLQDISDLQKCSTNCRVSEWISLTAFWGDIWYQTVLNAGNDDSFNACEQSLLRAYRIRLIWILLTYTTIFWHFQGRCDLPQVMA